MLRNPAKRVLASLSEQDLPGSSLRDSVVPVGAVGRGASCNYDTLLRVNDLGDDAWKRNFGCLSWSCRFFSSSAIDRWEEKAHPRGMFTARPAARDFF